MLLNSNSACKYLNFGKSEAIKFFEMNKLAAELSRARVVFSIDSRRKGNA
jgi:hypothetical protein